MGAGWRPVLTGLVFACVILATASGGARAQDDFISVDFGFSPAKSAYLPGEEFSIDIIVVNTMASGDYVYDSLAYMVKVTNVSVHFYWMAPNEWIWDNVSSASSWLAPDGLGIGTYALDLAVPEDASAQTYSYYFKIEYQVHTAWGNITYTWGTDITYKDFTVETQEQPAEDTAVLVDFGFVPAKSAYCPGENFSIDVTVINTIASEDYAYDSLAYMVKVTNVSVRFYWMPPNEWAWKDVSSSSAWLAPDGLGTETYRLGLTVPDDACAQAYSYYFRVEYLVHMSYGNISDSWSSGVTYRDFTVEDEGAAVDLFPYFAAMALVVSIGAFGAVLYHRRERGAKVATASAGALGSNGQGYPVLRPLPGEQFPIEKGFIYLVKEKRPSVAFSMFNEAVAHGADGMLISREHPNRLRQVHEFDAKSILWLTRRAGENHVDPTELSLVSLKISRFVEERDRAVVLVEGAEYLITQNDFETVLRFVNHLHDFVLAHDCAIVIVIDPRVLSTRELALLERSAKVVEPMEAAQEEPPEESEPAET